MDKANSKCLKCGADSLLLFKDHCTRKSCENYDPMVVARTSLAAVDWAAVPTFKGLDRIEKPSPKFEIGEIAGSENDPVPLYRIESMKIRSKKYIYDVECVRDCNGEINSIPYQNNEEELFRKLTENEIFEWQAQKNKDLTEKIDTFAKAMKS